eukprot:COSAG01_NODE_13883_length_1522_cov_3.299368_2_plen_81_part_00
MPAKKKVKALDNLNSRLSLVVKSGKITLGHRSVIKALRKSQGRTPSLRPARCAAVLLRAPLVLLRPTQSVQLPPPPLTRS